MVKVELASIFASLSFAPEILLGIFVARTSQEHVLCGRLVWLVRHG